MGEFGFGMLLVFLTISIGCDEISGFIRRLPVQLHQTRLLRERREERRDQLDFLRLQHEMHTAKAEKKLPALHKRTRCMRLPRSANIRGRRYLQLSQLTTLDEEVNADVNGQKEE